MDRMNITVVTHDSRRVGNKCPGAWAIAITVLGFTSIQTAAQVTNPARANVAQAQSDSRPNQQEAAKPDTQSPSQTYFTDVLLVNQNDEKMRFYSDLLRGKVVVINSFFATCPGSCLPMERNLEKVQQALGDRLGKDVHIISISVDPTVDTPANLKEYAKKLNARPGWYFLTGEKQNVDFALKKLGHLVANKQDHLNIFIIGNERTGLWKKAFGLAQSDQLIKVVESVLNDKAAGDK
ncbi:MAG: SCO family protein [Pyrinomonadaceae bacterium]|nr:SCO family protein [Pyrinomonadaceae bacterium]